MGGNSEIALVKSGICKLNIDTLEIFDCDSDFAAICGYKVEGIRGKPIYLGDLLIKDEFEDIVSELRKNFEENLGRVICREHAIYNPILNMKLSVVANIIFRVYVIDNIRAIDIIFTDSTDLRRDFHYANEKRDEALFMVDTIMESFGGALINYYPETGEILFVNNSCLELFGYDADGFKEDFKNNFENIIKSEDRRIVLNLIKDQIKYSDSIDVTFRTENSIGNLLWVTCKGKIVDNNGNKICYANINDITELRLVQDMISEVNLRMETLISNIPGGVSMFAIDKNAVRVVYANDEYYRLFGYTRMEYEGLPDNDIAILLLDDDANVIAKGIRKNISGNTPLKYEVRARRKDGSIIWISITARYYKHMDERPMYYAIVLDVTERKNIEYELKLQTERYKLIEDATDEFQFEYLAENDTLFLPKKEAGGIEEDVIISSFMSDAVLWDIIHATDAQEFKNKFNEALKKPEKGVVDFKTKKFTDKYEWYRAHYVSIENEFGKIDRIVGRFKNVQKDKDEQEKLEKRVKTDPMTGILNKVAIKLSVDDVLSNSDIKDEHALMLIDLDKFKNVNDMLGHMIGDKVILDVVDAMKKVFITDELLGRAGGDEFVVFIKNSNRKKTEDLAKILCKEIKQKYSGNKKEVDVSSSIGIAYFIEDGFDYNSLFSKADIAMYYSKLQGGNRLTTYKEIIDVI